MNYWLELGEGLGKEEARIPRVKKSWRVPPEGLSAYLTGTQSVGDRACDKWILTGRWPTWTPEQIVQVTYRLTRARRTLVLFRSWPFEEPENEERFLRWLLIDSWRAGGPDEVEIHIRAKAAKEQAPK